MGHSSVVQSEHRGSLAHAIEVANTQLRGMVDKQGQPLILHSMRVMLGVPADCRVAGVLHDVVEDSAITVDDLRFIGFAADDVEAVDRLSRRKEETYFDYVRRCCAGYWKPRMVKLVDLNVNLDRVHELPEPEQGTLRTRYLKARDMVIASLNGGPV